MPARMYFQNDSSLSNFCEELRNVGIRVAQRTSNKDKRQDGEFGRLIQKIIRLISRRDKWIAVAGFLQHNVSSRSTYWTPKLIWDPGGELLEGEQSWGGGLVMSQF
ncbi:hypothetical protein SUGI_1098270 [Cryptomeria japonica]|nr:hypothetical protein SUGI_1098270 [Cryptomeria japonica]